MSDNKKINDNIEFAIPECFKMSPAGITGNLKIEKSNKKEN